MLTELLALAFVIQSPEIRRGFWLSGGYGIGTLDCSSCSKQDNSGQSWYLGLGGTVSKHVLIGLESNVSVLHNTPAELRSGYVFALTTYWYPSPRGGFYLKGGVGPGFYSVRNTSPDQTSDGGVFMVGTGYDIRLAQRITVAPSLTFWTSTRADLQTDSATLANGFRHSGAALQVGVRYQSPWGTSKTPHEPYPQIRKGFWFGLGLGMGNIAWQCDGCAIQDHGVASGFVRAGGTVSNHLLLGVELRGSSDRAVQSFSPDSERNEVGASYGAFAAYWYPHAAGGGFLKAGVGVSQFTKKTNGSGGANTAGAIMIGAGYDLRAGSMVSFTPTLTVWGSTEQNWKDGSSTVVTSLRHTGAMFEIGLTWH